MTSKTAPKPDLTESFFKKWEPKAWPYNYGVTLLLDTIAGGTPSDPKAVENWLRQKLADKDDLLRQAVAQIMAEREIPWDEAVGEYAAIAHLNGFRRDTDTNGLYIMGYQVKAMIKEAGNIAVAANKLDSRKWGATNKGWMGFCAEHIQVREERIPLGVTEPSRVVSGFIHTYNVHAMKDFECVENAKVSFTIAADWKLTDEQWAMIWLTAELNGLGAERSQGFGRFKTVRWEPLDN